MEHASPTEDVSDRGGAPVEQDRPSPAQAGTSAVQLDHSDPLPAPSAPSSSSLDPSQTPQAAGLSQGASTAVDFSNPDATPAQNKDAPSDSTPAATTSSAPSPADVAQPASDASNPDPNTASPKASSSSVPAAPSHASTTTERSSTTPAPSGTKKFSSSLSVNKKFVEKAGTSSDPSRAGLLSRPSSHTGRTNTPSPGLPSGSTPPLPSTGTSLPASSTPQAPRLISGKIQSAVPGRPVLASASSSSWGRPTSVPPSSSALPGSSGTSRYETLVPPNVRSRVGAASSSAASAQNAGRAGASAATAPPVWGKVPQPSGQKHPTAGQSRWTGPSEGEFPSVAEAARSSQLKAHAMATALAAKESQDKKAKEEAAAAAAEYRKHMLEEEEAFRGVHLKDHAHWDEMDDDDDFGDIVDFGDGATYNLHKQPEEKPPQAEDDQPTAESEPERPSADRPAESSVEPSVQPPPHPVNEYDRGGRKEGKSLFNDRLGKLEPYVQHDHHQQQHHYHHPQQRRPSAGARSADASRPEPFARPSLAHPPSGARQRPDPTRPPPSSTASTERRSFSQDQRPAQPPSTPAWNKLPPAATPALDLSKNDDRAAAKPHIPQQSAPPPPAPSKTAVKPSVHPSPPKAAPAELQPAEPPLTKDAIEAYHNEMQSAAERARKRRQEEEAAREAEAKRLKEERLRALDEKIKASQPQPAPQPTKSEAQPSPSTSNAANTDKPKTIIRPVPIKPAEANQPRKILSPPTSAQPSATSPVAASRADAGTWRRAQPLPPPVSPRQPHHSLPPHDTAPGEEGEAREGKERHEQRQTITAKSPIIPTKGPFAPKSSQDAAAPKAPRHERTDRQWRRATPLSPPLLGAASEASESKNAPVASTSKALSHAKSASDDVDQPRTILTTDSIPAPVLTTSVWPEQLRSSHQHDNSEDAESGQPRASTSPSDSPSNVVAQEPSKQPKSRNVSFAVTESEKAAAQVESEATPRVRLNSSSAKAASTVASSSSSGSKHAHKSTPSTSSFDDVLARIKGVMDASSSEQERRGRSRRPSPPIRFLSESELERILLNFAVTARERSPSPRPVWKVIPKIKLASPAATRPASPLPSYQVRLLKKAEQGRPPPLRPCSVGPAFDSSRSQLFHRRGAPIVKLKPSMNAQVVEARPLRDPRPGNSFESGPWRQSRSGRTSREDTMATGSDIFESEKDTPAKPSINVVLPTPKAQPAISADSPSATPVKSRASPKPQVRLPHDPSVIARPGSVDSSLSRFSANQSKSRSHDGVDPHAVEFVPRSRFSGLDEGLSQSSPSTPKSTAEEHAATLSLVKSVWDQPSPDSEAPSGKANNSLHGLMMDDFPSSLPTMADLRSEDGISAPSSRNLSPVSQSAAALPAVSESQTPNATLLGATSALSGMPGRSTPSAPSSAFAPTPRPASTDTSSSRPQPVNTMPLPGVKNTAFSGWSPGPSQPLHSTSPTPSHSQPLSAQGYSPYGNSNLSNLNPAFSGGIWMPIGQSFARGPPQAPPQPSINPFAPVSTAAYQPYAPHSPHGYPSPVSYPTQPRSPVGSPYYGNNRRNSQGSMNAYGAYPDPAYSAFAQPGSLSPFTAPPPVAYAPAQPHTTSSRGVHNRKRW